MQLGAAVGRRRLVWPVVLRSSIGCDNLQFVRESAELVKVYHVVYLRTFEPHQAFHSTEFAADDHTGLTSVATSSECFAAECT